MALTDSLIYCLECEEASGDRADATGTVTAFIDNNTVTRNTGKVGFACEFTLLNDEYLIHANNASLNTNTATVNTTDWTIGFWGYLAAKTTTQVFMSKGTGAVGLEYNVFYDTVADRFKAETANAAGLTDTLTASTFGSPSIATFYYIMATWTAATSTMTLSVNAGTRNSAIGTGRLPTTTGGSVHIGEYSNAIGVVPLGGRMDQICFWKRVLNGTDEALMYNSGNGLSYAAMRSASLMRSSLLNGLGASGPFFHNVLG